MSKTQATSADLQAIAEAKIALGRSDAHSISEHTGIPLRQVEAILEDSVFIDLFDMFKRGEFRMWAGIIAKEEAEISRLVARIGYDAVLRLKELIRSPDEKVANSAIRTALEYNADLERPVVVHEFRSKFTPEELDKAREVVRIIRENRKKLPAPADGTVN